MSGVQIIGAYITCGSAATLLLCGLYWLGHRQPLEPRTPRLIIRADDYLRSCRDVEVRNNNLSVRVGDSRPNLRSVK